MNLLAGPTGAERSRGFDSSFSSSTAGSLQSVSISLDGQAVCSFQDFSRSVAGDTSRMLDEIRATIFQFPEVQSVLLQFDDDCQRFWSWLGKECAPLYR